MAFLFEAVGRIQSTPSSEMANPTRVVIIRPDTLADRYSPKRTTTQPSRANPAPISFSSAGCAPRAVFPSKGLIFKEIMREAAKTMRPTIKPNLPPPDEKYAIPAVVAVNPAKKSVKTLPCDFVAAIPSSFDFQNVNTIRTIKKRKQHGIDFCSHLLLVECFAPRKSLEIDLKKPEQCFHLFTGQHESEALK
jgi:hypothetical protein